jgi:hypothetical protein
MTEKQTLELTRKKAVGNLLSETWKQKKAAKQGK